MNTHSPDNYADALDTVEAARITRATASRWHRAADGTRDPRIPEAERKVSDGLKIATVHAGLAQADQLAAINRTLVAGLDGISTRLGDLIDMLSKALADELFACDECDTDNLIAPGLCDECAERHVRIAEEALEHPDDTDCARCGGPISPTADMCEACKQHADEEIDGGYDVSGPHEGEGRA